MSAGSPLSQRFRAELSYPESLDVAHLTRDWEKEAGLVLLQRCLFPKSDVRKSITRKIRAAARSPTQHLYRFCGLIWPAITVVSNVL